MKIPTEDIDPAPLSPLESARARFDAASASYAAAVEEARRLRADATRRAAEVESFRRDAAAPGNADRLAELAADLRERESVAGLAAMQAKAAENAAAMALAERQQADADLAAVERQIVRLRAEAAAYRDGKGRAVGRARRAAEEAVRAAGPYVARVEAARRRLAELEGDLELHRIEAEAERLAGRGTIRAAAAPMSTSEVSEKLLAGLRATAPRGGVEVAEA